MRLYFVGYRLLYLKFRAGTMALLDKSTTERYLTLPQPDSTVQVMYVWIDGSGENVRCKTRTVDSIPKAAEGMKNTVHPRGVVAYVKR